MSSTIILLSALQGFFLSSICFLQARRKEGTGINFLAIALFLFSLYLLEYYGVSAGFYSRYPELSLLTYPLLFFIGPLIIAYSCDGIKQPLSSKMTFALFAIPTVIYALFVPFFKANMGKLSGDSCPFSTSSELNYIIYLLDPIVFPFFTSTLLLISAFFLFNRKESKSERAYQKERNLWIKRLHVILIGYFILIVVITVLDSLIFKDWNFIVLAIIIHVFAYQIVLNPQTLHNVQFINSSNKYNNSSLDNRMRAALLVEIKKRVETNRAYMGSNYSIHDLSTDLGVSVHNLSQVINQELSYTFNEYLNKCRVEEAKARLMNKEGNSNVSQLALDVGFNNRVTFYRSFKKHSDVPLSQFR